MSTESTQNDKIVVNVGVFYIESVDVESHSALTQLTESLTLHRLSVREMNQAKTAYITSSGAFKGIGFRKVNEEMFKWGQYQSENVNSFYIA